jgi:hypothetical protein
MATTQVPLSAASNRPLTADDVARGLGQLGDNTLRLAGLDTSGLQLEQGK